MLPASRKRQEVYSAHPQHGTTALIGHLHKDHETEWNLVFASNRSAQAKSQRVETLVEFLILSKRLRRRLSNPSSYSEGPSLSIGFNRISSPHNEHYLFATKGSTNQKKYTQSNPTQKLELERKSSLFKRTLTV